MLTMNFDRCTECEKDFKCREAAQTHYFHKHPNEMQICPECDMLITNSRSIMYHWKTKHVNSAIPLHIRSASGHGYSKALYKYFKQNQCKMCQQTFENSIESRNHYIEDHKIEFELCSICFKGFRNENLVKDHWWQKHYDMPFVKYGIAATKDVTVEKVSWKIIFGIRLIHMLNILTLN